MKTRELANLGIPKGQPMKLAQTAVAEYAKNSESNVTRDTFRKLVLDLVKNPQSFIDDKYFSKVAELLMVTIKARARFEHRAEPAPYVQWGTDIEDLAINQMNNACLLPISVRGALMPDAHTGYGLPIGGVLATENAVIPFAVGMDIACRMKLTVLDLPINALNGETERLKSALCRETSFGVGAAFRQKRFHDVMDQDWTVSPITHRFKDKAWSQLGTSGSGNHFVEFGILTIEKDDLGLSAGQYLALLSHSGSRGTGNEIATHYSKLALEKHPELPHELSHLAWLNTDSAEGKEYWAAMELMGRYAAANHELIHKSIAKNLKVNVLLDIENHHNFAWKELHDGKEVIVHRKGATPAGKGDLGIIPGSMATPGYIVRGRGYEPSLNSASHGAGRKMSRKKAKETYTWSDAKKILADRGVNLLSAGLDEVPMAYKDIDKVMSAQSDLVQIVAKFDPKMVRMAKSGR